MKIIFRPFIVLSLLLLLIGMKGNAQTLDYSYVVVGCNRVDYTDTSATTGTPLATGLSTANVYQLNRLFTEVSQLNPLPKFLFIAGDFVMGYIADTTVLESQLNHWKQIYANHPISTKGIQLVVIPGNHETQNKAAGKKSFVAAERTFLRVMAPYIIGNNGPGIGGPDNLATDQSRLTYSFNYGCDHFILVDTDPVGQDARVPYHWISSDIQNARNNGARHIFTIGHKPAYESHFATPLDGLSAFMPQRDSLWKYLENNQCEAMFSAHNHLWDTIHPHPGKTWQVIAGNGGSRVEPNWMGSGQSYFGFTQVNIYKNNQVNVKSYGRDADMTKLSLNEDENPTSVRADFNIGISPVINHTVLASQPGKGPFNMVATITDDMGIVSAQLNYSLNGVAQAPVVPSISGNIYSFTIPVQSPDNGFISYQIQTNDASGFLFYSTGCATAFNQFFFGTEGPSSSQTAYVNPVEPGASFKAVITTGDTTGGYRMCGTPDGLGAFDNGNGTFTLLMNHEFVNSAGAIRAHGSKGAFVSKWVINKSDLSVVSGSDLIKNVNLWNGTGYSLYNATNPSSLTAFSRFCSADLPAVSAFYNKATGLGTQERIFMNGEENGAEGRLFGHIVTGINGGTSYELPALGKFSSENAVANPVAQDKTIVAGMDDSTPGQVYIYIGTKTNSGTEVEKAGLTNGKLYGISVAGLPTETNAGVPAPGTAFSLIDLGDVRNLTGTVINSNSNTAGVTTFLRPEDGAWDPSHPSDLYFNTTNAITSPSRLWRVHFTDIKNPELGGTIEAVLDGTEGQKMLDNMAIDNSGHIILLEDVGNNPHNGKVWQYTIATDVLTQVGQHDPSRFISGGANFLTEDEETSGVIDVQSILGPGMFLLVDQAHYPLPDELVEGGQLLALFNPDTYNTNPEIAVSGNGLDIINGDASPSAADNTDFGLIFTGSNITKTFKISNISKGKLTITDISFTGTNAGEFTLVSPPVFPLSLAANDSLIFTLKFSPTAAGSHSAVINISNTDLDESNFSFALKGQSIDFCTSTGTILREVYTKKSEADAKSFPVLNLPLTPSRTEQLTSFEIKRDAENKYIDRIRGYVCVPVTGDYTFYIASDDAGALYLSSDEKPANKTLIAYNLIKVNYRTWDTYPSQTSSPIHLKAGYKYYIESVHFEWTSSDHLSVGWKLPSGVFERPIPGMMLSPYVPNVPATAKRLSVDAEENTNDIISFYPNPVSNIINIAFESNINQQVQISVADMNSSEVMKLNTTVNMGDNIIVLDLGVLKNGMYVIRLTGSSTSMVEKIMVIH